jgi:hypothetical protein
VKLFTHSRHQLSLPEPKGTRFAPHGIHLSYKLPACAPAIASLATRIRRFDMIAGYLGEI